MESGIEFIMFVQACRDLGFIELKLNSIFAISPRTLKNVLKPAMTTDLRPTSHQYFLSDAGICSIHSI